jgi:hypothetical protein
LLNELFMVLDKLDLGIIALYLAGITLFGLRFRKKQRTLRDTFSPTGIFPGGRSRFRLLRLKPALSPSSAFPAWLTTPTDVSAGGAGLRGGAVHHQFRPAAALFPRRSVHRVRID